MDDAYALLSAPKISFMTQERSKKFMKKQNFIPHELKDLLMKEDESMQNKKTTNTAEKALKKKAVEQVQGTGKDQIPDFDMILGQGVHYSRDDYRTKLNNNVCVVGTSGAGKTRSIVKPNLMQASGSYVVSDAIQDKE